MPHFEDLVDAKTFAKSLTPQYPTDTASGLDGEIAALVGETTDLLRQLKVKALKTVEKCENLASPPETDVDEGDDDDDGSDASGSENGSDEGYESEAEIPIPVRPKPLFDLNHNLTTSPKTQHFAKTLTVHALHPASAVEGGQIIARYINLPLLKASLSPPKGKGKLPGKGKAHVKTNFFTAIEDLNTCNSDGLAFATALFCPKGTLAAKHKSTSAQYCGPWGSELEGSAVLVVQYLCVDKSFRRQGVARLLLGSLLEEIKERMANAKSESAKVKFVAVYPAVIKEDFKAELEGKSDAEKVEIEAREYRNAVGAYRALGFRRVGRSKWFALAVEKGHVSRGVKVEDDLDEDER